MVISLPFLDPTLDHIPRYLRYNLYLARMGLFVQGRRSPGDASTLKKKEGDQNCFSSHPFFAKR